MAEELISFIRGITVEGRCIAHLIHCFVQGFNDGRDQRLGYISDAETDDLGARVSLLKGGYFFSDIGKQIASL